MRLLTSAIIGLLLAMSTAVRAQTPVAVVLDLTGQPLWQQAAGAKDAPLALLQALPEGSVLVLAGPARVVLGYPREVLELQGAGRYRVGAQTVTALDPGARVRPHAAPAAQALTLVPERVAQGAVRMRGADSTELVLSQPRGTQWERSGLLFQWQGPAGRQRLELIDDQGELVARAELDRQEWSPPPVLRLDEGRDYVWRVMVSDAQGAQREARASFRLLPAAQRAALVEARPAAGASVAQRTRYALALEQAGLQDEAQRVWRALARERPALAERLLSAP